MIVYLGFSTTMKLKMHIGKQGHRVKVNVLRQLEY